MSNSKYLMMPQFTIRERVWLVERYFQTYGSGRGGRPNLGLVKNDFEAEFRRISPTKANIIGMVRKYREEGSVQNQNSAKSGRPRTARTNDNHETVMNKILTSPKKSIYEEYQGSLELPKVRSPYCT